MNLQSYGAVFLLLKIILSRKVLILFCLFIFFAIFVAELIINQFIMYIPNNFSPSSFSPNSMMGMMPNLGDAKGKNAAVRAAVVATILAVLYILFSYWPLASETAKLVGKMVDNQKTFQIVSVAILLLINILGLFLAKCIIGMTENTPGKWAGTLISIVRTVGVIYNGTILSYVITESRPSSSFIFNTEGFIIAYSIGAAVFFMLAAFFFLKAIKGGAGVMLMLGYFLLGVLMLGSFLLSTYGDLNYEDLKTLNIIFSILSILAVIITVAGYYANLKNYDTANAQAAQPSYGQQPPCGQQSYGQPYQQPQQPQYQPPQQPQYQPPRQPQYQPPQQPQYPPQQSQRPSYPPQQPPQSGSPMPPPVPPRQ